jgi:hypothetical protein
MLPAGKEGEDTQVHAGGERDTALGKGEEDEDQTGRDRYSSSHRGTGQRCNLYGKVCGHIQTLAKFKTSTCYQ